jgi:hypothetical protein
MVQRRCLCAVEHRREVRAVAIISHLKIRSTSTYFQRRVVAGAAGAMLAACRGGNSGERIVASAVSAAARSRA